jgi:hypothetical protein
LCDCCSTRHKLKPPHQPNPTEECEFGHATHYKYNSTNGTTTTPRMVVWYEVYDSS